MPNARARRLTRESDLEQRSERWRASALGRGRLEVIERDRSRRGGRGRQWSERKRLSLEKSVGKVLMKLTDQTVAV